jgi:F0F1-type ATP synthase assembly protein I
MQDPIKSVAILGIANIPLFIFIYFSFFSKKNRKGKRKGKHRKKSRVYLFPLIFTYIIILVIEIILVYKLLQIIG